MRGLVFVVSLCVAGTAWAQKKPIVDSAHFIDESRVFMQLGDATDDYWMILKAHAVGVSPKDRARLDVRIGGKLQGSYSCLVGDVKNGEASINCDDSTATHIKKGGALEADLILVSDADDKEYLLRRFKANAKTWNGKKQWQLEPDDMLGTAYFAPETAQTGEIGTLRFWVAGGEFVALLRCTVDGKSLPDITGETNAHDQIGVTIDKGSKRTQWTWSRIVFESYMWLVDPGKYPPQPDKVYLSKNPGTWQCQLRNDGITVREFTFKVNAKGDVEPHPMQSASGAPPMLPRVAQIDVRIPKDNGLDKRIKPDAIKKSRGYGLPWPQHDSVKAVLAALPPAYENANPVAAKKPAGKLLIGSEANPPKLIDESSAGLRLRKEVKGYSVHSSQIVSGVTQEPSNRYRLEWKQGGKTVATVPCSWKPSKEHSTWAFVDCEDQDQDLTVKGAVEGHLIFTNDKQGQDYLLRVYKVTVAKYPSMGDPVWQIVPDDVLATAWADQGDKKLNLRFWLGVEDTRADLRCTVDGKKLADIALGGEDDFHIEASVSNPKSSAKYVWRQAGGSIPVLVGMPGKGFKPEPDRVQYLGEYPGKWDCAVRQNGKVLRQLLFTVNSKGLVEPDPEQAGVYFEGVVPIELRFGKDILDVRVRPDAMKKSRGFGLPWPKPPTKPFPKASGLPDPK